MHNFKNIKPKIAITVVLLVVLISVVLIISKTNLANETIKKFNVKDGKILFLDKKGNITKEIVANKVAISKNRQYLAVHELYSPAEEVKIYEDSGTVLFNIKVETPILSQSPIKSVPFISSEFTDIAVPVAREIIAFDMVLPSSNGRYALAVTQCLPPPLGAYSCPGSSISVFNNKGIIIKVIPIEYLNWNLDISLGGDFFVVTSNITNITEENKSERRIFVAAFDGYGNELWKKENLDKDTYDTVEDIKIFKDRVVSVTNESSEYLFRIDKNGNFLDMTRDRIKFKEPERYLKRITKGMYNLDLNSNYLDVAVQMAKEWDIDAVLISATINNLSRGTCVGATGAWTYDFYSMSDSSFHYIVNGCDNRLRGYKKPTSVVDMLKSTEIISTNFIDIDVLYDIVYNHISNTRKYKAYDLFDFFREASVRIRDGKTVWIVPSSDLSNLLEKDVIVDAEMGQIIN